MERSASPPSSMICPRLGRMSPAISRRSDDFPAPFGPVIASVSPLITTKPSPWKTSRPPRTHASSSAASRIIQAHSARKPPARAGAALARPIPSRRGNSRPTTTDFVEDTKKSFYKPSLRPHHQKPFGAGDRGKALVGTLIPQPRFHGSLEPDQNDFTRQFPVLQNAQDRQQDVRLLQPRRGGKERTQGHLALAVFPQSAALKFASPAG